MAEAADSRNLPSPELGGGVAAMTENPWLRQVAVMVGIAASVALGVAVVLWSQAPNYAPLYGNLAEKDASQVMEALQQVGVDYRVDQASGMVMVPAAKVKELRMQLAGQGLPNSVGMGFELLQQDTGFGTSQMVEKARYQQAMQGELARTIATIGAVQSARVHLAIPKQSVFVRKRQPPSASVALRLHSGRILEEGQVEAIVHMVASSIPELEPGRVTVVDHKGRLLSGDPESREMKLSATQFEHTRRIEEHYRERIESLLAPIVGRDKVRAQVTADVDFTVTEQTQERYNPDQPALRSEQVNEEQMRGAGAGGVPGALSNQPPAAGNAPENAQGPEGPAADAINSSRQATRNYELDRVISHTRNSPLSLRRLSVAVVVDDISSVDADGNVSVRERTPEEIERLTDLVREAVGFDTRRGDSVRVLNSSFLSPEPVADLPEIPIWEQGWFLDTVKQVGGLLLVLVLIFVVLKPTMKRLTASHAEFAGQTAGGARVEGPLGDRQAGGTQAGEESLLLGSDGEPVQLPGGGRYENIMDAARNLVDEDPKRVAQLVKTWMHEEAA
ncbi:MAG: flagellar M-ring protein FliF [Chromatiaceae bacterium]|nr:flagellar M-ring protein FliF [Gammaproteobacteria bacterium]MCP5316596.1 flagellar M-ring protein FliF [Chromatiaceae bacterium]MCW5585736.1 flagellar M-ring protein FliF [Chromatiales bacterium]MCP5429686.1 flagellar M-ring protein FliF [Chromatiaceae bacterium]MCP5434097.1 flagellar M-ring protein FliF [Chromatiaceae bacterium]